MNARRHLIPTALAGTTALALTSLSACSSADDSGRDKDGKLSVVASFYPLQFLAEEIGGNHVDVTSLTKPGVEPHDLEITARQTASLSEAGLVVYLKGLQPAVDHAVDDTSPQHVVEATSHTSLKRHGTAVDGHEHGADDTHDHGGEHGHGGDDPHIWLDPVKYAEVAKGLGEALEKADPDHASSYRERTDNLVGRLDSLNKEFATGLKNTPRHTFITTHAAFGYLAERYGLDQEAISGIDPESEPSPARMKQLHQLAEKNDVNTVFFETLANDATAKTLAKDAGLRTDALDPLEGITDASRGEDYFAVMRANLTALRKALGAK